MRSVAWSALAIFGTVMLFAPPLLRQGVPVTAENGPLCILGCLLLFVSSGMMLGPSLRRSAARGIFALLGTFYFTLALRELDLRRTGAPAWLVEFTLDARPLWLTPIWILLAFGAWRSRAEWLPVVRRYDWGPLKRMVALMAAVFLASYAFERRWFAPDRRTAELFEETFELVLEWFMLGTAWLALRASRDLKTPTNSADGLASG